MIAALIPLATKVVGPRFARAFLWLALSALLIAALGIGKCTYDSRQRTAIGVAKRQTSAATQSGADAVDTVGRSQSVERAADEMTRENDDAIRFAPGADAPVDPAVRDAGLAGLCRRASYRNDPKCVQFAPAR